MFCYNRRRPAFISDVSFLAAQAAIEVDNVVRGKIEPASKCIVLAERISSYMERFDDLMESHFWIEALGPEIKTYQELKLVALGVSEKLKDKKSFDPDLRKACVHISRVALSWSR